MRKLLIAVTLLIIYGSLYPFNVSLDSYDSRMLSALFYFGLGNVGRGDFVANVALFVPFGFLAMQSAPHGARWKLWILTLGCGFLVAHAIQALQLLIPGRVPSGSDSLLNVLGCALGCALGSIRAPLSNARSGIPSKPLPIPTLLAVFLVLWNLRPFIPSIDLQLIIDNLKHVLANPVPQLVWTLQGLVTWLIVFHFLVSGGVRLVPEKFFIALVLVTLGLSFFIVGNSLTIDRLTGGLLSLPAWVMLRRFRPTQRSAILSFLLLVVIAGMSFTPFELLQEPREFKWFPFSGALGGNLFINVLASFKKALLYGCLIYLLVEMGFRLKNATLLVAFTLLVSEILQIFFVSTTPEITDCLLALMIGAGFHLWDEQRRKLGIDVSNTPVGTSALASNRNPNGEPPSQSGTWRAVQAEEILPVNYISGMDGLRAVAALAVFFVHFNQQAGLEAAMGPFDLDRFLANGNTGVALFFTLSGLLLSMPFWQASLTSGVLPDIRTYALRRAARILPAYYLCLFSIIFAMELVGSHSSWDNVLRHVLFLFNFSDRTILSFNQPFWTLAVEMQFYILLPLLFLLLKSAGAAARFWLILGLVPLLYFVNFFLVEALRENAIWPIEQSLFWPFSIYLKGPESAVLTYSTLAHLPHFLIGVLGARVFLGLSSRGASPGSSSRRFEIIVWVSSLVIFLILATPLDDLLQIPLGRYNFPFVPLLLAAVVVCLPFTRIARDLLELRWVSWLGRVSYGIYIYHYPVQKLVSRVMSMADVKASDAAWLFGAASLVITLLVAYASYRWLEIPVMRWIRRRGDRAPSTRNRAEVSCNDSGAVSVSSDGLSDNTVGSETIVSQACQEMSSQAADERCAAPHELLVNLHQSQHVFLQSIYEITNLAPSEVCTQLIDGALASGAAKNNEFLYQAIAQGEFTPSSVEQGSRRWSQLLISLDDSHFVGLGSLAADQAVSRSRMMRHLLADFIKTLDVEHQGNSRPVSWLASWFESKKWIFRNPRLQVLLGIVGLAGVLSLLLIPALRDEKPVTTGPHWAGNDANLVFDPHTHTRYSDGKLSPAALVELSVQGGCDALVVSDHSDKAGTVSDEQIQELQNLRALNPELLLFNGIELNMPTYNGREHAGLIASPSVEAAVLQQLRDMTRISSKKSRNKRVTKKSEKKLLATLATLQASQHGLFMVYNHPSRKVADLEESYSDIVNWNSRAAVFGAFEGAPGHQNAAVTGSYKDPFFTRDGWDPVVAEVGGVWDRLLSAGHQIWGALASSDYHNDNLDKAPCSFSRTHLIAPRKSYSGVMDALKSGTFWADHGRILDQMRLSVYVEGLGGDVYPGSSVSVGSNPGLIEVTLSIQRGPGSEGRGLAAEFISNCPSGEAQVYASELIAPEDSSAFVLIPINTPGTDGKSCTIRSRVRLERSPLPDFMAYTNPVRLMFD